MPQVLRTMNAIFSGVRVHRGEDQVALVLAVVVVGHDDDFAACEGVDHLRNTGLGHGLFSQTG